MSDELALLTAIIAHPEEDTPRLVFADWLEENGQPERAEFIRVQIEITRLPERDRKAPHYRERLTRFRELIAAHRDGWVKPLAVPPTQVVFRRGFIEELRSTSGQLVSIGDAVLCREVLSSLDVSAPRDVEDAAFGDPTGGAVLRRLASWPGRGRLRELRLGGLVLEPAEVEAFVNSPPASGLRALDITTCGFSSPAVVRVFAACANLTELTELRLGRCELEAGDVLALARSEHLKKLRTVALYVVGENEPDTPISLRAALRQLRKRYPASQLW